MKGLRMAFLSGILRCRRKDMDHYTYKTKGTCSRAIEFDLDEGRKLRNIVFHGGCNGNLKGIARLCEGKDAEEVASILEGNTCGLKPTSCPDQLSKAIREALTH